MKNNPLFVFLRNYWWLLSIYVATNWACMTEMHFKMLGKWRHDETLGGIWAPATPIEWAGPTIWEWPFGISVVLVGLFILHLLFRDTMNADISSGRFIEYWKAASGELKLILTVATILVILLALSNLFSPLARA